MTPVKRLLLSLAAASLSVPAFAQTGTAPLPGVTVGQGWTRATSDAGTSVPGFFTIHNTGLTADTLVSASCPIARRTALLDASGKTVNAVTIAPGQTVSLAPGGLHLMLDQNRFQFYPRGLIPCSLDFLGAGEMILYLRVEPANAKAYQSSHQATVGD